MGLALAYKRGDVPDSKVSGTIKKLATNMTEKELEKFASTEHKGLPKKVSEEDKSTKITKEELNQLKHVLKNFNNKSTKHKPRLKLKNSKKDWQNSSEE